MDGLLYTSLRHGDAVTLAGTYEVKCNTLITHAIVAKNVGAMTVGGTEEATFKFEGNTFVATSKVASTSGRQTTYTRVR